MLRLSICLMVLLLFSCQQERPEESKQPNILFLFADDQRAGTIHALGNNEIITPNLDKLVNQGVSFTNNYIIGASSEAVCAPSRAMFMTGRHLYAIENNGWDAPILEETQSLPEAFKKAGYATFGTGKQHNGKEVFARGFTDGDEIFFGGMSDHWSVPVYHFDSTGQYDKRMPFIPYPKSGNMVEYLDNCDHILQGKHSSELFADAAIDFLNRRDPKKPFFAYVSFTAPHDPRSMPKAYEDMYDTASISIPPNFLPIHPWDFGELKVRDERLASFPRTKPDIKIHLRDYYAMITHLDAQIGRIIQALKVSGEYENTIIVFSADNGLAVGQHGLLGKQNLYEHSVNVPFVISGPGIPANEKRAAFTYLYDVFPTLCELVNVDIPESVLGKSFAASIQNASLTHRENMYYGYKEYIRAYRKEDFKLIEYFVKGERNSQLFNIKEDPLEINNLFDQDAYLANYLELKDNLIKEMKVLGDTNQLYQQLSMEVTK